MEEKKNSLVIDLRDVARQIRNKKSLFIKVWLVTFVLACAWILPIPRTYTANLSLAPEINNQSTGGSLGSIAATFGINVGGITGSDAFYPTLYPDLVSSNDFLVNLFDVKVRTIDGETSTTYGDYLAHNQKGTFYMVPVYWTMKQIKKLMPKESAVDQGSVESKKLNPFFLTEQENDIINKMRGLITCSTDRKTDVITITVQDQDPLIAATIADSVRLRLQNFIIDYRTTKARNDEKYYSNLVEESRQEYEKAVAKYGRFCDTHRDVILQSMQSERDQLENDMQMKYNTYNVMSTQLEAAKAKVQERTPAFTMLQGPTVPLKASSPKRMFFVAVMLFLATCVTILYIFKKEIEGALIRQKDS